MRQGRERETVQSEQEAEGKREGGEDKCNGLAIKRKVDGMHTEEQNTGGKVGRGEGKRSFAFAHVQRVGIQLAKALLSPSPFFDNWSAVPSRMQSLASRVTFI